MLGIGTSEMLVVAAIVLVIFGGKKIPELGKGLGKGIRNFQDGLKEIESDIKDVAKDDQNKLS